MSNNSEKLVKDIRRRTRKKYSSEEKIRIVLEGMRGEESIAELCRREGLNQNVYYRWSKEFLEAGKQRLAGVSPVYPRACGGTICDAVSISMTAGLSPRVRGNHVLDCEGE